MKLDTGTVNSNLLETKYTTLNKIAIDIIIDCLIVCHYTTEKEKPVLLMKSQIYCCLRNQLNI